MAANRNVLCLGHKLQACSRISCFATSIVPSRASSTDKPQDEVIHTGQKWEPDDYRMSRFVDKKKLVNPNWAIKLIDEVPPAKTRARVVSCDGGGGSLGHPKVYINLDKPGKHACGYCGLRFFKDQH